MQNWKYNKIICVQSSDLCSVMLKLNHSILTNKLFLNTLRKVLLCLFLHASFLFLPSVCFSNSHLVLQLVGHTNNHSTSLSPFQSGQKTTQELKMLHLHFFRFFGF